MSEIRSIIIFFCAVILVALACSFAILFIGKTGIRDKVISAAPELISKLFQCDFCLSFWFSLILAIILALYTRELIFLSIPVFSAPLTRFSL